MAKWTWHYWNAANASKRDVPPYPCGNQGGHGQSDPKLVNCRECKLYMHRAGIKKMRMPKDRFKRIDRDIC